MRLHETRAYTYFKDDPKKRSIVSICGSAYEDMAQLVARQAEKGNWKAAPVYLAENRCILGGSGSSNSRASMSPTIGANNVAHTSRSGPIRAESSYAKNDENRMSARTS